MKRSEYDTIPALANRRRDTHGERIAVTVLIRRYAQDAPGG